MMQNSYLYIWPYDCIILMISCWTKTLSPFFNLKPFIHMLVLARNFLFLWAWFCFLVLKEMNDYILSIFQRWFWRWTWRILGGRDQKEMQRHEQTLGRLVFSKTLHQSVKWWGKCMYMYSWPWKFSRLVCPY